MLQVMLVEDDAATLQQVKQGLDEFFADRGMQAVIHEVETFEKAFEYLEDKSRRFDLLITDTYDGPHEHGRAAALDLLGRYRGHIFAPIIVYSSASKPDDLSETAFVRWADKGVMNELERVLGAVLDTGVPTISSRLNLLVNSLGQNFVWGFLEQNWESLSALEPQVLERLMRRRLSFAVVAGEEAGVTEIDAVYGPEYFHYPTVAPNRLSLGEILRGKESPDDFRIILTPHCHLVVQPGQDKPRAETVLTIRMLPANAVDARWGQLNGDDRDKILKVLIKLRGKPDGRYWFVPGFLDVPNSYADFMTAESLPFDELSASFESVAVIAQPFAESLQQRFAAFYSTVGVSELDSHGVN